MAKSDLEARRKSSLSDCTWLENEFGSFNLESLIFLTHFREPGSLFYFYSYSHFFIFFFSYIFFHYFFFLCLSHFFFFFFLIIFFICSPLNSKIAPPPPCLDVFLSSRKEVIEIR
jgi:hypothetical protein